VTPSARERSSRRLPVVVTGPVVRAGPRRFRLRGGEDAKQLTWLTHKLGDRLLDRVIITTGPEAYRVGPLERRPSLPNTLRAFEGDGRHGAEELVDLVIDDTGQVRGEHIHATGEYQNVTAKRSDTAGSKGLLRPREEVDVDSLRSALCARETLSRPVDA
jgi:hypothetical protein